MVFSPYSAWVQVNSHRCKYLRTLKHTESSFYLAQHHTELLIVPETASVTVSHWQGCFLSSK